MKSHRFAAACVIACALGLAGPSHALGPESYVGTIALYGGSPCPKGTLPTDGRLLQLNHYTALFAIIGSRFGGDGMTSLALPKIEDVPVRGSQYCIVVEGKLPPR